MRTGQLLQAGVVPYARAYEWMHELAARRAEGEIPDTLLLLEHPPTYTAGRRSDPAHLVWTRQQMESLGAELHEVDRGGSVTFHGPGQLVGYPIVDLGVKPDVMKHLRMIEEVIIRAASDIGITRKPCIVASNAFVGSTSVTTTLAPIPLARSATPLPQ